MTSRKRRPPEKRRPGRISRLMAGSASLIGTAAMRNPAATGGTAVFAIVFSFVAANALWYQPSAHPHPWLDTRGAFRDYTSHAMQPGSADMTTYKIEHDPDPAMQKAAAEEAAPAAAPEVQKSAALAAPAADAQPSDAVVVKDASGDPKSDLIVAIQDNLARRGLYEGPSDGRLGPKTQAAIMFYQETRGLPETGNPDAALLDLLKKDNSEFNVIPADRRQQPATTGAIVPRAKPVADPVAGLIKATPARKPQATAPKPEAVDHPPIPSVAIPAKAPASKPAPQPVAAAPAPPSDLVMAIQKGLSNLAYKDVSVDGRVGEQTRQAIRHFQAHYRLPVTGEPNEALLEKLKKIGAL